MILLLLLDSRSTDGLFFSFLATARHLVIKHYLGSDAD